jgi:hypothetical protein
MDRVLIIMKTYLPCVILLCLCAFTDLSFTDTDNAAPVKMILAVPAVRQADDIKNLCAPACAEMVLRYYGIDDLDQYHIAEAVCAMVPAYRREHPSYGVLDCEWPDNYQETYQPILALYFEGLGFEVHTTRSRFEKTSGRVSEERFAEFLRYLKRRIPLIFHIQGHYMLAVGYDDANALLYYINPRDAELHGVGYREFRNRYSKWYAEDREGWDGRFLAVWK